MNKLPGKQRGSALVTLIVLAVIVYGVFIGIQYVPLRIESTAIDSVLESIEISHKTTPLKNVNSIEGKILNLLNINQMKEMKDSFDVKQKGGGFVIEVSYERELNLILGNKVMQYEKSLVLR
jgi:hypothetical protein